MNYKLAKRLSILFPVFILLFFISVRSVAQDIDEEARKKGPAKKVDSIEQVYYLKSKYFTFKNFLDTITYGDTVLTDDFPYFNPVHALKYPLADKGNIGSSIMPLSGYISRCGFNLGINGYDFYDVTKNEFKWQINSVPFAQVFGSPSSTYTNFTVGTIFSRNFKDINLNIDYKRINNTGIYKNQDAKHTDLNFGIWKGSMKSRFNAFLNFIVNIHEEEENGGVKETNFDPELLRQTIPVKLNNAVNRMEKFELEFTGYYMLYKDRTILGFKPYLKSEAGYHKGFYKFYDDNVSEDTLYYGALLTDKIGLRNYIKLNTYHASLALYGVNSRSSNITAGVDYGSYLYDIEPLGRKKQNQLKLFANTGIKLPGNINVQAEADLYLGNFSPNYRLKTELNYSVKRFIADIGLLINSSSPSIMQQKLYLTSKEVYSNDFKNIGLSRLYAGIDIKSLGFSARVNYDNISSYIYFSDNFLPRQHDKKINLISVNIEEKIRVWKLHFDNNLFYYNQPDDVLPVPKYVLRSKFYINTMLFKKVMELNMGLEHNLYDSYFNYGYNAAIGNYYVQNKVKLENFRRLDYFLSAKISDFMVFFRMNNIFFPLEKRILFTVIDHPHDDLFFRLGVKWTLLN